MHGSGRAFFSMILGLALLCLGCKDITQAPSGLSYSVSTASYITGTAITANQPTSSGGAITSYSVSPALPAGLNLNTGSGVISGTPTAATAQATYTVTGTNSAGSATASLSITVTDPVLSITTQPANQSVEVGATATFSVAATTTASGSISYQWMNGTTDIPGATSASYTTPATTLADSGSTFSVKVSDAFGNSVTSHAATLTVTSASGPGTCIATGSLNVAREFHTATLLQNGKVLIVGGTDGNLSLSSVELYDPATELFTTIGNLGTARQSHTATLLADGKVLIAGGSSGGSALASAEIYDPATGLITSTGSLMAARFDHTATLLTNGTVLFVAGRGSSTAYLASAEIYDPTAGTFHNTTGAPLTTRATHTATLVAGGKVLIAGGFRSTSLATAELYDPTAGTFSATGNLNTARSEHTATLLASGQVLIVGGATTATAELYDPAAGTFTNTGSLNIARNYWHTASLLPSGHVLIAGGRGTGTPSSTVSATELYVPSTGLFTASGGMNTIRELHTATVLATGKVLLAGGMGFGVLSSAELYY